MSWSAETLHKPTDTDFSAAVARLRDANCDLILLGTICGTRTDRFRRPQDRLECRLLGQGAIYDRRWPRCRVG